MTFPTGVLFDSAINLRHLMTRDFGGVGFGVLGLEEGFTYEELELQGPIG